MDADALGYVDDLIRTAEEHLGRARALLEDAELMIARGGHPPSPEPREGPCTSPKSWVPGSETSRNVPSASNTRPMNSTG